ncbi:MAG TPA: amidohydrolase family protein [Longimicrobiales bacterium]|nr:amidohydrolase family protein [Longimicrobiales bacterium]
MRPRSEVLGGAAGFVSLALVSACFAPAPSRAQEPSSAPPRAEERPIAILGGEMFDAVAGRIVPNPGILVVAGRIVGVGTLTPADTVAADVRVLAAGEVVLPGLIDLHAHYAIDLFGDGRVDELEAYPLLFLANGVTTTFPAGEMQPDRVEEAARRWASGQPGDPPGPRLVRSGPYFGSWRPGWDDAAMTPDSIAVEVDYWAARGVAGFKAKGIRAEQLRALIERAHAHGITVTGHLDSGYRGSVNTADAIAMGIDRIEHFLGGATTPPERSAYASLAALTDADSAALRSTIQRFLQAGVYFDATLSTYGYWGPHDPQLVAHWTDEKRFLTPYARTAVEARPPRPVNELFARVFEAKRRTLAAFYDAGGRELITLGTDHPSWGEYFSPFSAHREMLALVGAGIPAADVLRIATLNGARALGLGDRLGSIEPGKWADLVVVGGDPVADIRHARDVRWVVVRGRGYDPASLLAMAEGTIGPESAEDEPWWRPGR